MHYTSAMIELAPFVVCPETLGPLVPRAAGFWSPQAECLYPVREGLVFLGYPERDRTMIEATMAEEYEWQGTPATAARNLEWLGKSAPIAVGAINLASSFVQTTGRRAVDLGSGSGWVGWLLARAGYDTWMCDFEANSLASGLRFQHERLGEGRRFVTDARFAPFANETFDLVVCKEFVHHVADYPSLFQEANRILRSDGTLLLVEPTRSIVSSLIELRRPDPHEGHEIVWLGAYREAIRQAGFEIIHQTAAYYELSARRDRNRVAAEFKRRATRAVEGFQAMGWLTKAHLTLMGGASAVLVCRKSSPAPTQPRPQMAVISPTTLTITTDERSLLGAVPEVLEKASARLVPQIPESA